VDELKEDNRLEDKNELETMLKASSKCVQPTIVQYMAHRVRATCQFVKLKEEISNFTETSGGLWFDHKQKILPMRKHEGQIEYFGKRGMSLLGAMFVIKEKRIVKGEETIGLVYYFYDVAVDKYSSQDNVQVIAVLTSVLQFLKTDFPNLQQVMVGSDNASCLASHDNIPYIHYLNQQMQGVAVTKWIYTEACTGKNRLDTHFSFVNLKMKAYVLDGNAILTEKDICKAIAHDGGIAGTTAVLFNGEALEGPVLKGNKQFKGSKTGVRETHEVVYTHSTPHIYSISSITVPEVVTVRKLNKYEPNALVTSVTMKTKSDKPSLFVPDMQQPQQDISQNRVNQSSTCRAKAINEALILADVDFGSQQDQQNTNQAQQSITYIPDRSDIQRG
jgi:hypothetical protein